MPMGHAHHVRMGITVLNVIHHAFLVARGISAMQMVHVFPVKMAIMDLNAVKYVLLAV